MNLAANQKSALFMICLKTHHDASAEHSLRVASCALVLAEKMKLPQSEIRSAYYGALLHDIGKIGVSDRLLDKPAPLTDEETEAMQSHVWKGAAMACGYFGPDVTRVINEHHENWDGSGYPSGLSGESISLLARICAVVDTFDAIVYDRAYRLRASYGAARKEIIEWSGRQFDPEVVLAFQRVPQDRWLQAAEQRYEVKVA